MRRLALLLAAAALLAAPAGASARTSLVSVPISGPGDVLMLQSAGLDVTEAVTRHSAQVLLHGADDAATLARLSPSRVLIADVDAAVARSAQRSALAVSDLPSGRAAYRVFSDYLSELDALAQGNPGLVRRFDLPVRSLEGRPIAGVEIASNVNAADDGRPVYVVSALHHAREWPSGEVAMEFADDLVQHYGKDPRWTTLLDRARVMIVPVANPDGFVASRGEVAAAPAGPDPQHRRNCRATSPSEETQPCAGREGVDPNRNYGALWGGPGASTDRTNDAYRGTSPFSEPETQAFHAFSQHLQITNFQSLHNIAGQVLRQPGNYDLGDRSPDEARMKALGDAMAATVGYDSLLGYDLYPVHGATEDWNYIEQGAFGYTIELGPADANALFQGPYQTHVIDQYTGGPTGGGTGQGLREALLLAGLEAADPQDHSVIAGTAPPGRVLRVHKDFTTRTSRICVDDQSPDNGHTCPASGDPLSLPDSIDTTTVVGADGRFTWHVDPSTRPYEAAAGRTEAWTLTCEGPGGVLERRDVVVGRGETATLGLACGDPARASTDVVITRTPADAASAALDQVIGAVSASGSRAAVTRLVLRRVQRVRARTLRVRRALRVAVRVDGGAVRRLRLTLTDRSRRVRATRVVDRAAAGRRVVSLRLPRGGLLPGSYRLALRGTSAAGIVVSATAQVLVRR